MPVTKTTRRGNGPAKGAGWGGPAKGASTSRITADDRGAAIRALSRDPEHRAIKADLAAEMLAIVVDVARNGDAEAVRVAAADKAMDRLLGKATQTQVVEGGEKPVGVQFVWEQPTE